MSRKSINPNDMLWIRKSLLYSSVQEQKRFIQEQKEKEKKARIAKNKKSDELNTILSHMIYDFLDTKTSAIISTTSKQFRRAYLRLVPVRKNRRILDVLLSRNFVWEFLDLENKIALSLTSSGLLCSFRKTKTYLKCTLEPAGIVALSHFFNITFDNLYPEMRIDRHYLCSCPDSDQDKMKKLVNLSKAYKSSCLQDESKILAKQMQDCQFLNDKFYAKKPDEYTDYVSFIFTFADLGSCAYDKSNYESYKTYDLRSRFFMAYCVKNKINIEYTKKDGKIYFRYSDIRSRSYFVPRGKLT